MFRVCVPGVYRVCVAAVCPVSIWNVTGVKPLTGLLSMHLKGGQLGPPPVISHPESLAAQAAYSEAVVSYELPTLTNSELTLY